EIRRPLGYFVIRINASGNYLLMLSGGPYLRPNATWTKSPLRHAVKRGMLRILDACSLWSTLPEVCHVANRVEVGNQIASGPDAKGITKARAPTVASDAGQNV